MKYIKRINLVVTLTGCLFLAVLAMSFISLNNRVEEATRSIHREKFENNPPLIVDIASEQYSSGSGMGNILEEYYGPGGDVVIGDEYPVTIGTGAFNGARLDALGIEIDSVYLEDAVVSINDRAFYATSAKTIRLSSNLVYIGAFAFADSGLEKVYFDTVPTHEIEIDPNAFANSNHIEFINFPDYLCFDKNNIIK